MIDLLETIIPEYLVFSLGWTLIHSIWQSALVALALQGIFLLSSNRMSKVNYFSSIFALALILALSIRTFKSELDQYNQDEINFVANYVMEENEKQSSSPIADINIVETSSTNFSINQLVNQIIPALFFLWFLGFLFKCLASFKSFHETLRIKKSGKEIDDKSLLQIFKRMSSQLELSSSIKILKSSKIKIPAVIGYFKPVVLLPTEALTAIPKDQIEIIIAHELAHIYRADYLLNLLQVFIETIFFFNPFIWWISNKTREHREHCCDDIAIELTGNKFILAKALMNLAESSNLTPELTLSFGKNKHQLLGRINRMTTLKQNKIQSMAGSMILIFLTFIMISASGTDLVDNDINKNQPTDSDLTEIEANDILDRPHKLIFYSKLNGEKVKWEVEYDNHENITSLIIDGDEIDSDDFEEYEDVIYDKISQSEDDHYYNHEFDSEKFAKGMKHLKEKLSHIEIDFNSEEFEESMETLTENLSNIKTNIHFNFNEKDFQDEIERATESLQDMDINVNIDMEKLRASIENIKIDFDTEKFRESMQDLDVKLHDLDINMESLEIEMEKLSNFLDDVKEELVSDNLIDDEDEDFSMTLNEDQFIINDEEQPSYLHKKYLQIYEEHYDKELTTEFNID